MREDLGISNFTAVTALDRHRLVKLTADRSVSYCEAGDDPVGVTRAGQTIGLKVSVWLLRTKPGTQTCTAAAAITVNALIYTAADGKVSEVNSGSLVGRALQAASGDGSEIEVLPLADEDFSSRAGTFDLNEDFLGYVLGSAAELWAVTATDSGTNAVRDEPGGVARLQPSDGSVADNDEIYLHTAAELFLFADDKPIFFEARIKLTEANTDDANAFVGLKDAFAANSLVDDAGGPPASYSGVGFYKIDGGTSWLCEASLGATQTAIPLTAGAGVSSGTYITFKIEIIPTAANTAKINVYIDGVLQGAITGFSYSGATNMMAGVGLKNGFTNNETLDVDYINVSQVR